LYFKEWKLQNPALLLKVVGAIGRIGRERWKFSSLHQRYQVVNFEGIFREFSLTLEATSIIKGSHGSPN
jgi:hypothetical protein